ncbi:MAG TPA: thiamine pyrophosphate-dependent enzyme [Hyphomicrobiales bacterium]|nr:thiamine pyrophosphate-dependent enzyme [Hyphomicrobiales bacterium]
MKQDAPAAAPEIGSGVEAMLETGFALHAYRRMIFIRAFEKAVWDLSAAGKVAGSIHLCAGQEAIPVGVAAALTPGDRTVATYRGHGWALESGLDAFAVMSEICHRASGVNGGRAGSALMMAPDRGFIGENSIVGAGVPIADGVALALAAQGSGNVAVVTIGDGAMNQGATHEGLVFAVARKLPVVFVCENNRWSEMTPIAKIVPFERLARRAAAYGMPGATIDGCDPVAVRDTIRLAAARARDGEGPTFIECQTVRLWGHYTKDVEHYRPKEDRAEAERRDPIPALGRRLVAAGAASEAELADIAAEASAEVASLVERALDAPEPAEADARSNVVAVPAAPPPTGAPAAATTTLTYAEAVNAALSGALQDHPDVVVYGEDVGFAGGIFGCTRRLQRAFGEGRVFDTPISESAILGSAVGAAIAGLRPVVEIMWADFMLVALDQLINQASNVRYVTGGQSNVPMVVRTQQGVTPGSCAQHSQSLEALLFHIPGLRIGLPSTPQDAYDMLRAAIADPDPCIVIEARGLYPTTGEVDLAGLVGPIGGLRVRRAGDGLALVGWGTGMGPVTEAAELLAREGIAASVIDLRWLSPLPEADLIAAVRAAGGRAVIAHEANLTGGVGAEIVARLVAAGITAVRRVGTPDARMPAAPNLQRALLPDSAAIAAAARDLLG